MRSSTSSHDCSFDKWTDIMMGFELVGGGGVGAEGVNRRL